MKSFDYFQDLSSFTCQLNQIMQFINKVVKAPITYLADLRAITFKQYLHIGTNFSPSYPIMIFSALAFSLMYCAIIIYYVFNATIKSSCFQNVHGAAYLIAILYPIQTSLCFICLTGTIALSKNNWWKLFWMLVFGPILSGFGFGQVGILQLCLLSEQSDVFSAPNVVKKPGFVDAMVYLYISFLVMYFILVPSINYLYSRQTGQLKSKQGIKASKMENTEKEEIIPEQKGCCSSFLKVLYYILNGLFVISVLFILFIKVIGPIIFTYLWIQIGKYLYVFHKPVQKFLFAGLILAYFGPLSLMIITLGIQRVVKLGRQKKDGKPQENESKGQKSPYRQTWNPTDPKISQQQSYKLQRQQNNEKQFDQHPQKEFIMSQKGNDKRQAFL